MAWIPLALAIITGITLLLKYLLSDKRKIAQLKARQYELEEKLRKALAKFDTIAMSTISLELERLRAQLRNINAK